MAINWFIDFRRRHSKEIISNDSQLGPLSSLLLLEPCYKDPHNTGQILLSDAALKLQKDFTFWQHDYITVQKHQCFSSFQADFPMPSANHQTHKNRFSGVMSDGLFTGPQVILSF